MPKVSVLMPVYKTNVVFLKEAIESILNQTFTDFEFLILDDCPEDNRGEVISSYHDKRIKYFKNEDNLGITPSRNKLINLAKGQYLAIFDHDDISLPTRLEKEVNYLDQHPEVGVVSSFARNFNRKKTLVKPCEDKEIKLMLMKGCALVHSASMIRKSVLEKNNIKYEQEFSPAEDYALWSRLIPYTKFHNLNEVLFLYREYNCNTSHLQSDKMREVTFSIWAFVRTDNPVLYQEFLYKQTLKYSLRLFGFLPFLTIEKKYPTLKVFLFEKILLFSIKKKAKLKRRKK